MCEVIVSVNHKWGVISGTFKCALVTQQSQNKFDTHATQFTDSC